SGRPGGGRLLLSKSRCLRRSAGKAGRSEKSEASPRINRLGAGPRIRSSVHYLPREDAWGRTGISPAHPFGNLATIGPEAEGPWLCVPAFRRVCLFEDTRRCDPGTIPGLPPTTVTKADSAVRRESLGHE